MNFKYLTLYCLLFVLIIWIPYIWPMNIGPFIYFKYLILTIAYLTFWIMAIIQISLVVIEKFSNRTRVYYLALTLALLISVLFVNPFVL